MDIQNFIYNIYVFHIQIFSYLAGLYLKLNQLDLTDLHLVSEPHSIFTEVWLRIIQFFELLLFSAINRFPYKI